jgi:glycosyltransferase involved in cell wall biosynthesis
MLNLTIAMIVKNEEQVLERCLSSFAGLAEEVIIVDTGSTDRTIEIAQKFTDKIYHFDWVDDFSAARNYSFAQATCDYIMWLDADDVLDNSERLKFLELKSNFNPDIDVAMLKYNIHYDTAGNVTFCNYRERILKRALNFQWEEPVHEVISPRGNIQHFNVAISHRSVKTESSRRNLMIYEKQEKLSPRGTFYYARELKTHSRFQEAIRYYDRFLKEGGGWQEDMITAYHDVCDLYNHLGQPELAVNYLFRSFHLVPPRSEACCKIGAYFLAKKDYQTAIYWYELALEPKSHHEQGFFQSDYFHFIPTLQLCHIYDCLKNYHKSYTYHLAAKEQKPEDYSVKLNEAYFTKLFFEQKEA